MLFVDAWVADLVDYQPGGGESVRMAAERICNFYDGLGDFAGEHVVLVCHAGAIRLLLARHRGLAPAEMAQVAAQTPMTIPYGALIKITT